MKITSIFLVLSCCLFTLHSQAGQRCRDEQNGPRPESSLVLALDLSSSLDAEEYATQIDGYIKAFEGKGVQANLFSCGCTEIAVVLWGTNPVLSFPFELIDSPEALKKLLGTLNEIKIGQAVNQEKVGYTTDILSALTFSKNLLLGRSEKIQQKIINISGDGMQNQLGQETMTKMRAQRDKFSKIPIQVNGVPIVIYEYLDDSSSGQEGEFSGQVRTNSTSLYKDVADFYQREVITRDGYMDKAYSLEEFGKSLGNSLRRDTCNLTM